ncbi:zinc ribbon domain-containing protein [Halomarina litorea]|uniref:zinc ribbon domain-containing protein n=1 Tax=Halomarina litorea TaxID=2961595 RepID=UPI0020C2B557|nr:zinc ribbon domain-containing protein [Halomarina sp. BCD28]
MAARRPWLAAVLAVLYPGLGHVYLREWLRALLWFLLALSTAMLVVPDSAVQGGGLEAILEAQATLPPVAMAALIGVTLFSVVDAYWLASRGGTPSVGGREGETDDEGNVRCPNCRRTVDGEEYGFCPWCAAELEPTGGAAPEGDGDGGAGTNP